MKVTSINQLDNLLYHGHLDRIKILNLSMVGLKEVPENVWRLRNLIRLN